MIDTLWDRVVVLEIECEITRYIRTTREAVWCLLDDWSTEKGPSYSSALVACTNALAGKAPDALARLLFVAAARDAELCVKNNGHSYKSDPGLSHLTEAAFRALFGLQRLESPAAAITPELVRPVQKNHLQSQHISSTAKQNFSLPDKDRPTGDSSQLRLHAADQLAVIKRKSSVTFNRLNDSMCCARWPTHK